MLDLGQDVELLAAVGAMAVADQTELLENVQRPVDRRRRRLRVDLAAALDELAAGDMAVGLRQDVDERPALGRPPQAALMETLAEVPPRGCRCRRGHAPMNPKIRSSSGRRPSSWKRNIVPTTRLNAPAATPNAR